MTRFMKEPSFHSEDNEDEEDGKRGRNGGGS